MSACLLSLARGSPCPPPPPLTLFSPVAERLSSCAGGGTPNEVKSTLIGRPKVGSAPILGLVMLERSGRWNRAFDWEGDPTE